MNGLVCSVQVLLLDEDERVDYDLAKHKEVWEVVRAWALGQSYHRASISGPSVNGLPGPGPGPGAGIGPGPGQGAFSF